MKRSGTQELRKEKQMNSEKMLTLSCLSSRTQVSPQVSQTPALQTQPGCRFKNLFLGDTGHTPLPRNDGRFSVIGIYRSRKKQGPQQPGR